MRKYSTLLLGCILVIATLLPTAGIFAGPAGTTCAAFDGMTSTTPFNSTEDFKAGDTLTVTDTGGAGTGIELLIDGSSVGSAGTGGSITYTFTKSSAQPIQVNANGTGPDGAIEFSCVPAEEDDEDAGSVEICHYPPGNPYAAHTISVGQAAVQTHIDKHDDTMGACDPDIESRETNLKIGMAYFTMEELGLIDLYGACVEDACELLVRIDATLFTDDPAGTVFDEIPDDAWHVVVYYLHEHPDRPGVSIYQINVFENGILIDDAVLLLVDAEGNLIGWGTHDMWYD